MAQSVPDLTVSFTNGLEPAGGYFTKLDYLILNQDFPVRRAMLCLVLSLLFYPPGAYQTSRPLAFSDLTLSFTNGFDAGWCVFHELEYLFIFQVFRSRPGDPARG